MRIASIEGFSGRRMAAMIGMCTGLWAPGACLAAQRRPLGPAPSASASASCGQLADRLLETTGYGAALRGATEISRAEFQTGLAEIPNLSDADRSRVNAAFARAFDAASLRKKVREHLVARCDVATYQAVLAALASPLARRMKRIEDAAGTKAGAEALRNYFDAMRNHPPSQERVDLIEGLERSRHEVEFLESLLTVMARETATGFGAPLPSDADIQESMQAYLPMAKQMILMRELGVYRDAPDKDLVHYTAMWLSPAFQRFESILAASFDAALGSGVREAAQAVRPFLKRSTAPPAH